MERTAKVVIGVVVVAVCAAVIPLSSTLGLLILGIEPNPRHLPVEVQGAVLGWAIFAAFIGLAGAVIGEPLVMEKNHGVFVACKGFVRGGGAGLIIALFFIVSLAVLHMNTISGQAITSVGLAVLTGGTVAGLSAVSGAVGGAIIGRSIGILIS